MFEIKDGDRVLFLGDTLLEREGTYGYLETRMVEQFPDRKFTVRNLAFSADTPMGWSRASFDPPAKGFERLKEQLALVKPTVVFLGYGMAASLQEMTDRSQDWTLNRDPARYGAEPMSAARFKKELAQCMDAIVEISRLADASGRAGFQPAVPGIRPGTPDVAKPPQRDTPSGNERNSTSDAPGRIPGAAGKIPALPDANPVRFVLLSPIRHEDLRATRPGLPDPTEHNKLLEQYSKAIEELAKERGARFINLFNQFGTYGISLLRVSREEKIARLEKALAAAGFPPRHATFNAFDLIEEEQRRKIAGLEPTGQTVVLNSHYTDNGIHPSKDVDLGVVIDGQLGWDRYNSSYPPGRLDADPMDATRFFEKRKVNNEPLRQAIIRKNALFFHRWRPANETYLFGFRKREQGQNAVEIPKFDPLIEAAEAEIERLKRAPKRAEAAPALPVRLAGDERPRESSENSPALQPWVEARETGKVPTGTTDRPFRPSGTLSSGNPEVPSAEAQGYSRGAADSRQGAAEAQQNAAEARPPAEKARPSAENARQSGENARQSAEKARPFSVKARAFPAEARPFSEEARPFSGEARPFPAGEKAESAVFQLKTPLSTSTGQFYAANETPASGDRRVSGRAGLQPAVPGILPGTPDVEGSPNPASRAANNAAQTPSGEARKTTPGAPGRIPGAAGKIPALPGAEATAANNPAPDPARQTPAETPDLSQVAASPSTAQLLAVQGDANRLLPASPSTLPLPTFTLADGLEISLWAENPLLAKPTECNWDAQGRLWVASSAMYPMIAPGQAATDKIIILEDPGHTGKATKATVFVDGLLIPTGVAPVLVQESGKRMTGGEERASGRAGFQPAVPGILPGTSDVERASNPATRAANDPTRTPSGDERKTTSDAPGKIPGAAGNIPALPEANAPRWGCYVGQSTELLYFEDTDGDGKADRKRIVFSGFGTEDTHHIVHTLRWGPDGRLYFSQSVYIHTHLETPWGVVRVNSGGVFAYDPRTERVEVVEKGLWNTWGHAWDEWGQSFYTDGAGSTGLSWGFPGATFAPSEGARRTMASISPGSYPKFAGLELIYSPHFPAEWQGSAVTCDFRAHKVVHFKINDLGAAAGSPPAGTQAPAGGTQASQPVGGTGKAGFQPAGGQDVRQPAPTPQAGSPSSTPVAEPKSGYVTDQLPVLVQTSDATFRPIDVKLGPDGALYIADWSNPIINHGEVDFRDPRRDHEHGRIWRLSRKGGAAVKWESLVGKKTEELLDGLVSKNLWNKEHAREVLIARDNSEGFIDGKDRRVHAMTYMWAMFGPHRKTPVGEATLLEAIQLTTALDFDRLNRHSSAWDYIHHGDYKDESRLETEVARAIAQQMGLAPRSLMNEEIRFGSSGGELGASFRSFPGYSSPRFRVEAMRTLCRSPRMDSVNFILDAAINAPKDDPQYEFAAWLSINDLAPQVAEWVEKNSADPAANTNAPNGELRSSGRAGLQPAVPGILPGTPDGDRSPNPATRTANDPARAPSAEGRTSTSDAPGRIPGAAGNIPALPGNDPAARDAKIVLALQSLPPETSAPLLAKILATRGLPRDGSGPWIELIGATGGPGELRLLLDGLLAATTPGAFSTAPPATTKTEDARARVPAASAGSPAPLADAKLRFTTPDANRRAAAALVAAARRGVKPAGDAAGELAPWQLYMYAPDDALPDVLRLAGLWKQNVPAALFATLDTRANAAVLDAAFEALRTLATPEAADFLTAYFDPALAQKLNNASLRKVIAKSDNNWRIHALLALAPLRPDAALKHLDAVLAETPEPQRVNVWRTLFAEGPFMQKFMQSIPANFPPATAATALRAARELGRRGQPLVTKLSPLAGEKAAATTAPADYNDLAARAKKDGDPVAGEAIYRRMASACTTCHAIGGAGGKLGPDMTSIGASAPPDYIIESILNPAAKVKEGYHAFSFTMKDGTEAIGIPSRETPQEQFIRTLAGEQGLPKANIVSKKIAEGGASGASLMPPGLTAAWSDRERLNLYAFLMELGRPGPFDASKNNVARAWQLTDSEAVEGALKTVAADVNPQADRSSGTDQPALSQARLQQDAPAIFAYTLVDGRLTKDLLAEKIAMLAPKSATLLLTARFQAATAGKVELHLAGIRKAWLDGQPLAIASEPSPSVELTAGAHAFTVEVDAKSPPEVLRLESPAANFLGD